MRSSERTAEMLEKLERVLSECGAEPSPETVAEREEARRVRREGVPRDGVA